MQARKKSLDSMSLVSNELEMMMDGSEEEYEEVEQGGNQQADGYDYDNGRLNTLEAASSRNGSLASQEVSDGADPAQVKDKVETRRREKAANVQPGRGGCGGKGDEACCVIF